VTYVILAFWACLCSFLSLASGEKYSMLSAPLASAGALLSAESRTAPVTVP